MEKTQHSRQYKRLLSALRSARELRGMSQKQASQLLNVYSSFIVKVETGERRIDVIELAQICKIYRVGLFKFLRSIGIK
jgi:transcriptional regulator with XRE-family HTH domain